MSIDPEKVVGIRTETMKKILALRAEMHRLEGELRMLDTLSKEHATIEGKKEEEHGDIKTS